MYEDNEGAAVDGLAPEGSGVPSQTGEQALENALRQWLAAVSLAFQDRGDLTSPRLERLTRGLGVVRRYTGQEVNRAPRDYARREVVRLEAERGRELRRLFWCRVDEIISAGGVDDAEAVVLGRRRLLSAQLARIARLEARAVAALPGPPALTVTRGVSRR